MPVDLLARKQTHFVLWRPGSTDPVPALWIGQVREGVLQECREMALQPDAERPGLWQIPAAACRLEPGIYHYWFKVRSTDPYAGTQPLVYCTDPTAWTVDRRFPAPAPGEPDGASGGPPAAVVLYRDGALQPCDPEGQQADWSGDPDLALLPPNDALVIYELPTRWSRCGAEGALQVGDGTFRDVLALVEPDALPPTYPALPSPERAHLVDLGVTALELLPPADSDDNLDWGYGTANFFAADFYLGKPDGQAAPTASSDLVALIRACHLHGMRFVCDMVTGFARDNPYRDANYLDFFIQFGCGDPEQGDRDGFGGDLWKFNYWIDGYDPIAGAQGHVAPARAFLKAYLAHWMAYYRIDGVRMDSINTVANYDFVEEFKDLARTLWRGRGGSDDRFLVVGEELSVPPALLAQGRLDGLWNEHFKQIVRQAILGRVWDGAASFEESIHRLIDCRELGFADGAQAVNYITSHDIGGFGNERLYDWLCHNGVEDTKARIKLAFCCLLTAVGIPIILAGEEFADQQDLDISGPDGGSHKQIDPVNFERLNDPWRREIVEHVARLVRLRTMHPALRMNDTAFIHADFAEGKRVLAWQRGNNDDPVVVVANFSDYGTPDPTDPAAEYRVPGWPATPAGRRWREVTQDREAPGEWIGREPIYAWEAKVYALAEDV